MPSLSFHQIQPFSDHIMNYLASISALIYKRLYLMVKVGQNLLFNCCRDDRPDILPTLFNNIHSPHCCRATVSCPPPWCGASATGRGGCPWWCPCGWSSLRTPIPSSGERWETARFLLRRTKQPVLSRHLIFCCKQLIDTINSTLVTED